MAEVLKKLFRSRSCSPKCEKTCSEDESPKPDDDQVKSHKTDGTKRSKKKKHECPPDVKKATSKSGDSEACKEYIIKDDVGQVKLTKIINNSIKEAVLSIVKEGICPLADESKKFHASDDFEDNEPKPESPKNLSTLNSTANKTFESHLCRSQYQQAVSENPPSTLPRIYPRRKTASPCNHETCPKLAKDRKSPSPKSSRSPKGVKNAKQKEKKLREPCTKISRQAKGSSHFRTDNRRMTGNVNIYICSEANENNGKPKKKDENCEDSETPSETKTCASSTSISTSKLVAALKKKKRKNADRETLSCLCDTQEDTEQLESTEKSEDDVLCICEENPEQEFSDTRSSSSRDGCLCADTKMSEYSASNLARESDLRSLDRYTKYNQSNSWSREAEYSPSDDEADEKLTANGPEMNGRCSCCNLKRCQKDRGISVPDQQDRKSQSVFHRESRDKITKCCCISKENKDENYTDKRESQVKFSVCTNKPIDDEQPTETDPNLRASVSKFGSDKLSLEKSKSSKSIPKISESPVTSTSDTKPAEAAKKDEPSTPEDKKSKKNPKDEKIPASSENKRRDSFLYRSFERAMSIVKGRKDEDGIDSKEDKKVAADPASSLKPEESIDLQSKVQACGVGNDISIVPCDAMVNTEKRSRTKISMAIASRRSLATSTTNSCCTCPVETRGGKLPNNFKDQCTEPPESWQLSKAQSCCRCCCKKSESPMDENCCCEKSEPPKDEISRKSQSSICCPKCKKPIEKCTCGIQKTKPVEACKCCPKCKRALTNCKCCRPKPQEEPKEECCKCCRRPKPLCCCDTDEKPRRSSNRPQLKKSCPKSPDRRCRQDDFAPKSMVCIYCDKPEEKCICSAPIRKCSQCCLPLDVCNCKPATCCDCSGRQIISPEDDPDQSISVSAWKPRRNVRRYFARSMENVDEISEDDCDCCEKSKPYGSEGLPYQKRGVFSDVMSELQQKISGSVCCNVCGKDPCCCCCETIETRPCLSTIAERTSPGRSQKRSRSKSPTDGCKCVPNPRRKARRKPTPTRICDRCRTSPCRCKRSCNAPQKKPQAKCYYCKNSPCICVPVIDTANSRSFRNADSSQSRRMERCCANEENNSGKIEKREDNREIASFVPCPGNQAPIRKYCYRSNTNAN